MAETKRYVDGLQDSAAPPLELAALMEMKYQEIVSLHRAFHWASMLPRRLGGDATPPELGQDKRILSKLVYLYGQVLNRWTMIGIILDRPNDSITLPEQQFGAQVTFPEWIDAQLIKAQRDKVEMATAALQKGDRRSANKTVACLDQEITGLIRIRSKFFG